MTEETMELIKQIKARVAEIEKQARAGQPVKTETRQLKKLVADLYVAQGGADYNKHQRELMAKKRAEDKTYGQPYWKGKEK